MLLISTLAYCIGPRPPAIVTGLLDWNSNVDGTDLQDIIAGMEGKKR